MGDLNNPTVTNEIPAEVWPDDGKLPEQMGGQFKTLLPGSTVFRIPDNLASLWDVVEIEDNRAGSPTKGQKVKRARLKFDRNNPLVVVSSTNPKVQAGDVMTATFTTNPRPRGKKDDPATPWISDVAYLLRVGLNEATATKTTQETVALINRHAGGILRLEHGLGGQCRADKVRRIVVTTAEGDVIMEDPQGTKGCGKRYYTDAFKTDDGTGYDLETQCACDAIIRGFENVERILTPPAGTVAPAGVSPAAAAAGSAAGPRV